MKEKRTIDDPAMIDFLAQLYLADILEKELSAGWTKSKQLARKILDEIGETSDLFK